MKKFITILVLVIAAMTASAQTYNIAISGKTYALQATDYTVTNTTAVNLIWFAANDFPATQDYLIQLDSVSGNHTNVAVALYGAKFVTGAYSAIGSAVNWKGTTPDTTIIISNATANRYRYYKVVVTGTGTGVSKVDSQELKLYQE
jgi:hypothetical protein